MQEGGAPPLSPPPIASLIVALIVISRATGSSTGNCAGENLEIIFLSVDNKHVSVEYDYFT